MLSADFSSCSISATKGSTIVKVMRITDVILGILLIATYPIDMITGSIALDTITIFMFIYCVYSLRLFFNL